ncbi:hypothetical protein OC846_001537 [Tilletia horrida]|uniref:NADP-dependent oxidoreductase domain-containing protein n=1 Tax=Tilletia horrida TaxID=155126 RepID=A0AAN6GV23_9BASI|nr:hypothetical protein OC845_000669 [Tilletia horrida]KAK0555871.1 hypothetical protein OC846_001537 [Tilletia horrida]KAK0568873.1 hypothetical protein OC861_001480 [Tilletia horrida]
MSIPTRQIGKNGPKIPQIGYGAMGLAAFYGPPSSQEVVDACLQEVIKQGVSMIDTSDIYTDMSSGKLGLGEEQIGRFLKSHPEAREKLFIATKFGFSIGESGLGVRGEREYVSEAIDASLKRLGVDHIDLYYHHRPSETDVVETAKGLKDVKEAGKTKYVGVSEYTLEDLKRANEVVHIDAYQIEASPWTPDIFQNGIADWCRENQTLIVPYSPLGRSLAARSVTSTDSLDDNDFRKTNERFSKENLEANLKLTDALEEIAKKKGNTTGQIAIAWLLAKDPNVIPIPGSTKPHRIAENTEGARITLTPEEVKEIDNIISSFKVSGDRYSGAMASLAAAFK